MENVPSALNAQRFELGSPCFPPTLTLWTAHSPTMPESFFGASLSAGAPTATATKRRVAFMLILLYPPEDHHVVGGPGLGLKCGRSGLPGHDLADRKLVTLDLVDRQRVCPVPAW